MGSENFSYSCEQEEKEENKKCETQYVDRYFEIFYFCFVLLKWQKNESLGMRIESTSALVKWISKNRFKFKQQT